MTSFSPREIVSELDRFMVGQNAATRVVVIAGDDPLDPDAPWRSQRAMGPRGAQCAALGIARRRGGGGSPARARRSAGCRPARRAGSPGRRPRLSRAPAGNPRRLLLEAQAQETTRCSKPRRAGSRANRSASTPRR
ncbi:MAG: hypothetical protein FJX57_14650 [Alphaproteobacteria bacterium]|nr:hypothetical protein [Alphaproteobacteria bacterium]